MSLVVRVQVMIPETKSKDHEKLKKNIKNIAQNTKKVGNIAIIINIKFSICLLIKLKMKQNFSIFK